MSRCRACQLVVLGLFSGPVSAAYGVAVLETIVAPYDAGSSEVRVLGLDNATKTNFYAFRLRLRPPSNELASFNLLAAACDVDPGPDPAGDSPIPPEFTPTDLTNDRNVYLRVREANGQTDFIARRFGPRNPHSVTVSFTRPATAAGTLLVTPLNFDGQDVMQVGGTSGDVVVGQVLGYRMWRGGRSFMTEVTLGGGSAAGGGGGQPLAELSLRVPDSMRVARADVNPGELLGGADEDACLEPANPCWNDSTLVPDFNPSAPIGPEGRQYVQLVPASPSHIIQPGQSFIIQFELTDPVTAFRETALIGMGVSAGVPAVSSWALAALALLILTAGSVMIATRCASAASR